MDMPSRCAFEIGEGYIEFSFNDELGSCWVRDVIMILVDRAIEIDDQVQAESKRPGINFVFSKYSLIGISLSMR